MSVNFDFYSNYILVTLFTACKFSCSLMTHLSLMSCTAHEYQTPLWVVQIVLKYVYSFTSCQTTR